MYNDLRTSYTKRTLLKRFFQFCVSTKLNCSYHSGSLHPIIFFAHKSPNYHYYGAYTDNTPCCTEKLSPCHK